MGTAAFNALYGGAFSNTSNMMDAGDATIPSTNKQPFSGADIHMYVNNRKVGNLDSITWSVSTELAGRYAAGSRDAQAYNQGKRVIVGSLVLSQYDRDAFLDEIFMLDVRGIRSISDLWSKMGTQTLAMKAALAKNNRPDLGAGAGLTQIGAASTYRNGIPEDNVGRYLGGDYDVVRSELSDNFSLAAKKVADTVLDYPDQMPPFDITLIGINKSGAAARCMLYGVTVNQFTTGFSMNDIGNTVGLSFVALKASPWRRFTSDEVSYLNASGSGRPV